MIETPQLVHSTTNDYSHSLTHLSASAVLSMQSNIPNIQKNEEIHNSPEYIETSFPIQSSCTPSESFEKEERKHVWTLNLILLKILLKNASETMNNGSNTWA